MISGDKEHQETFWEDRNSKNKSFFLSVSDYRNIWEHQSNKKATKKRLEGPADG